MTAARVPKSLLGVPTSVWDGSPAVGRFTATAGALGLDGLFGCFNVDPAVVGQNVNVELALIAGVMDPLNALTLQFSATMPIGLTAQSVESVSDGTLIETLPGEPLLFDSSGAWMGGGTSLFLSTSAIGLDSTAALGTIAMPPAVVIGVYLNNPAVDPTQRIDGLVAFGRGGSGISDCERTLSGLGKFIDFSSFSPLGLIPLINLYPFY